MYRRQSLGLGGFLFCAGVVALLHLSGAHFSSSRHGSPIAPSSSSSLPTVTTCEVVDTLALPADITAGPDGNLWFTEEDDLGSITTKGEFLGVGVGIPDNVQHGIAVGPDGNIWFTEQYGNRIGRLVFPSAAPTPGTTTGAPQPTVSPGEGAVPNSIDQFFARKRQEFKLPSPARQPFEIVRGPDGNLWFTEQTGAAIGRITPAGRISEFRTPTQQSAPAGITAGPDGNLWFTEQHGRRIGRITPTGIITEFPLPKGAGNPVSITTSRDGNLWFAEDRDINGTEIGRITPDGRVTDLAHSAVDAAGTIVSGPDGNLWLTGEGAILRVTPRGVVNQFNVPGTNSTPYGLTTGPDGNLWFTDPGSGAIGRITPHGVIKLFSFCTS
jgi:streptogramin lyase